MSLVDEYRAQSAWRRWGTILDALPPLGGRTVLDLGCGIGDQAAALTARGARVIGFDLDDELLRHARARGLANAEFHAADLRSPLPIAAPADGIWCSFAAAYLLDLPSALRVWKGHLRTGGFIVLVEVDDLFGHEPLAARARTRLDAYAREALAAGRYDFHMGRRLRGHLELTGFTVSRILTPEDDELSFTGAASREVLEAWRRRFDRMPLLRDLCGPEFAAVRDDFLACLASADHGSLCRVVCCLATNAMDAGGGNEVDSRPGPS